MKTSSIIKFKIDGESHFITGAIEFTTGEPKREEVVTADGRVLYKETPTAPTLGGKTQERSDFQWRKFQNLEGVNIILETGLGKTYQFHKCFFADQGKGATESGELSFKFVATGGCEEII